MEGAATASNEETKPTLIQPQTKPKCPRCDSSNTKFCYYNNYSLSQPRFFCKSCRRYWTYGGTLRNVPIGGGTRKPKRPKTVPSSSPSSASQLHLSPETLNAPPSAAVDTGGPLLGSSSYSSAGYLSSLEAIHSTLNESSVVEDVGDSSFGLSQHNWTHPSFGYDDHTPTWTAITNSISSSSAGNNENSSLETEHDCCNLVPNHHGHDHDHEHLPPYARLP